MNSIFNIQKKDKTEYYCNQFFRNKKMKENKLNLKNIKNYLKKRKN